VKVLYLSSAHGADYMCDIVFHGLRSLLGPDCVDVNKMWFMYDNSKDYMFHSLYKLLPDIEVDRSDIPAKVASHYFDCIVYGSVHRFRSLLDSVCAAYAPGEIVFIDGEDGPELVDHLLGKGWYYKRELYTPRMELLPIQFGVPKEKIRPIDISRKTRLMAHCDPRDRSTYVYYDSEQRYYDQYSDAWFGYTKKKGGWDCMRHHEIIAAGALPYFKDFDQCPAGTLATFDRVHMRSARVMHDTWSESQDCWESLMLAVRESLLTTEDIATQILERIT
jgi:hypothetical protein